MHRKNERQAQIELSGYFPYMHVQRFGGVWRPFNQTATGHVETIRKFNEMQKNEGVEDPVLEAAVCQGIALKYIRDGYSLENISRGVPALGGQVNANAIYDAIGYQGMYRGSLGAIEAMKEMGCMEVANDSNFKQLRLNLLLDRIKENAGNGANLFYIVGACHGTVGSTRYDDAAHAFVIAKVGNAWKFFEAQRGEVTFAKAKDNLGNLLNWLMEEAHEGTLRELVEKKPVQVRVESTGLTTTRFYDGYTLGVYKDNRLINENKIDTSMPPPIPQRPFKSNPVDQLPVSTGPSQHQPVSTSTSVGPSIPSPPPPQMNQLPAQKQTMIPSQNQPTFQTPSVQISYHHARLLQEKQKTQLNHNEFVRSIDAMLEHQNKNRASPLPANEARVLILSYIKFLKGKDKRFQNFTSDDYYNYKMQPKHKL